MLDDFVVMLKFNVRFIDNDKGYTVKRLFDVGVVPVRCAPPQNRPSGEEFNNCRWFLEQELIYLTHLTVVVVLGRLALDSYLRVLKQRGAIQRISSYPFGHNRLNYLP